VSPTIALGIVSGLRYAFTRPAIARNMTIALVVGLLLTAANHYEVLLRGPYTRTLLVKVIFNFLIPFLVSSVSAAVNRPRS